MPFQIEFDEIQAAKQEREERFEDAVPRIRGVMVAKDYTNSSKVAGQPGWVWWKRANQDGNAAKALNPSLPPVPGVPIVLELSPRSGVWEVAQRDLSGEEFEPSYVVDNRVNSHRETHAVEGSDPLYVQLRAIVPLRASPQNGLKINIAPLTYWYDGEQKNFGGVNEYDLSGSQPPSGEGLARYVLVYLNPSTNAIATVDGSLAQDSRSIRPSLPAVPSDAYPSAYVRLSSDATELQEIDFRDARLLLSSTAPVAATQTIYVSKDGNDSNSGQHPNTPKLTIDAALTAAAALTPTQSAPVVVNVLDAGVYNEQLNLTTSWIDINAPNATLTNGTGLPLQVSVDNCNVRFREVKATNGSSTLAGSCVRKTGGSGLSVVDVDFLTPAGQGHGVANFAYGSQLFVRAGIITVSANGSTGGIGIAAGDGGFGHIHAYVGDIYLSASNAIGIEADGSAGSGEGTIVGHIEHILSTGGSSGRVAIKLVGPGNPTVHLTVDQVVNVDTLYDVAAGTLRLVANVDGSLARTTSGGTVTELSNYRVNTDNLDSSSGSGIAVADDLLLPGGRIIPAGVISDNPASNQLGFLTNTTSSADSYTPPSPFTKSNSGTIYFYVTGSRLMINSLTGQAKLIWADAAATKTLWHVWAQFAPRAGVPYGGEIRVYDTATPNGASNYWALRFVLDTVMFPQWPWRVRAVRGTGVTYAISDGTQLTDFPHNPLEIALYELRAYSAGSSRFDAKIRSVSGSVLAEIIGNITAGWPTVVRRLEIYVATSYQQAAIDAVVQGAY